MEPFNLTPVGRWIASGGASTGFLSPATEGGDLPDQPSFGATLTSVLQSPPSPLTTPQADDASTKKPAKDNSKSSDAATSNGTDVLTSNASEQDPSASAPAPVSTAQTTPEPTEPTASPAPQKDDKKPAIDPSQAVIINPHVVVTTPPQPAPPAPAPSGAAKPTPSPKGETKALLVAQVQTSNASDPHPAPAQKPASAAPPQATADNIEASAANSPQTTPAPDAKPQAKNPAAHVQPNTPQASSAQASATDTPGVPTAASAAPTSDSALAAALSASAPQSAPDKEPAASAPDPALAMPQTAFAPTHADAGKAEIASAAQHSPAPDTPDTFDQVMLGLQAKFDARAGKADIRLEPPNLGTLHVSVSLENGQLTAEFQSASTAVRDLLKGNLDKLKTALQNQGVAVDRLAVDAPPSAAHTTSQQSSTSFGSATHDGRSAGQYQQDGRSGHRSGGGNSGEGFARMFTQAQDAPLDLVA